MEKKITSFSNCNSELLNNNHVDSELKLFCGTSNTSNNNRKYSDANIFGFVIIIKPYITAVIVIINFVVI